MTRRLLLTTWILACIASVARADFTEYEDRPDLDPGGAEVNPLSDAVPVPYDLADFLVGFPNGVKLVRGSLDAGDIDAYAVSLQSGDLLLGALFDDQAGGSLDLALGVFSGGSTPALALDDDGGRGFHAQLGYQAGAAGTFQLGVTGFGDAGFDGSHGEAAGAVAPYRLVLGVTSDPPGLQESDLDPGPQGANDLLANADLLPESGGLVRATLPPGDVDHFAIDLEEGDRLDVAVFDLFEPGPGFAAGVFDDAIVALFDPAGQPVGATDDDSGPGFGPRLSFVVPSGQGGRWTLAVSGFDDAAFAGAHDEGPFPYALLAARDRACSNVADVIDNDSIAASTSNSYVAADLMGGDHYYTDRTNQQSHVLVDIPEALECAEWIKTANNDKGVSTNPHLTFTLLQDATVYIGYDTRATAEPAWLSSDFTPLGLVLDVADPTPIQEFDVLRRDFPAGPVALGGNQAPSAGSNYVVIAQPIDTSDPSQALELPSGLPAGTVALTVSGVLIEVPIPAGQSAAQVAQALADAVNADPSLQTARIFGIRTGNFFVTTGTIDAFQLPTAAVPAASPLTLVLLAALIAGLGLRRLRAPLSG